MNMIEVIVESTLGNRFVGLNTEFSDESNLMSGEPEVFAFFGLFKYSLISSTLNISFSRDWT